MAGSGEKVGRVGDAIVYSAFDPEADPPVIKPITCSGGEPTVANTDTVVVQVAEGDGIPVIDLRGGPFAPGATPEADGSSEIEFSLPESGFGVLLVVGSAESDSIRAGEFERGTGINLNDAEASPDVDFSARDRGMGLILAGRDGDDRISLEGGPPFSGAYEAISQGGATGQRLFGGPGRDSLTGGRSYDQITPGLGRDRVRSLGGSDEIYARDGTRDRIDCGAGRDRVHADPQDRWHSCEGGPGDPGP